MKANLNTSQLPERLVAAVRKRHWLKWPVIGILLVGSGLCSTVDFFDRSDQESTRGRASPAVMTMNILAMGLLACMIVTVFDPADFSTGGIGNDGEHLPASVSSSFAVGGVESVPAFAVLSSQEMSSMPETLTAVFQDGKFLELSVTDIKKGDKITPPAPPPKDGYEFDGWYDQQGVRFQSDTPVEENITLTARWNSISTGEVSSESPSGKPMAGGGLDETPKTGSGVSALGVALLGLFSLFMSLFFWRRKEA